MLVTVVSKYPGKFHLLSSKLSSSAVQPAIKHLLSSEGAALGKSGFATSRLAEDCRAAGTDDDRLCVGENSSDSEATRALDVHEEGPWGWYEGLWYAVRDWAAMRWNESAYLELVLSCLSLRRGVEEVNCENL